MGGGFADNRLRIYASQNDQNFLGKNSATVVHDNIALLYGRDSVIFVRVDWRSKSPRTRAIGRSNRATSSTKRDGMNAPAPSDVDILPCFFTYDNQSSIYYAR